MNKPSNIEPIQIRCPQCNDGTLMNRVPGTPTQAKYRCMRNHIKLLAKPGQRIHVWGPRPPDNAA